MMVAIENERSRFNARSGLASQGFSDVLRAAAEAAVAGGSRTRPTAVFDATATLLFTVAYEMLGSAADAEDVVQEVWLRWAEVDRRGAATRRLPRADRHPAVAEPAADPAASARGPTSARGCPSRS